MAEHEPTETGCSCGWEVDGFGPFGQYSAHLAAVEVDDAMIEPDAIEMLRRIVAVHDQAQEFAASEEAQNEFAAGIWLGKMAEKSEVMIEEARKLVARWDAS